MEQKSQRQIGSNIIYSIENTMQSESSWLNQEWDATLPIALTSQCKIYVVDTEARLWFTCPFCEGSSMLDFAAELNCNAGVGRNTIMKWMKPLTLGL
jgi:hypothetical protein